LFVKSLCVPSRLIKEDTFDFHLNTTGEMEATPLSVAYRMLNIDHTGRAANNPKLRTLADELFNLSAPELGGLVSCIAEIKYAMEDREGTALTPAEEQQIRGNLRNLKENYGKLIDGTPNHIGKKTVNGFMVFRSFYNGVLGPIPQKFKSAAMKKLWNAATVYQPAFMLLGKAYSIIRDQVGKDKAPMERFLALISKEVGIIQPRDVLDAFGFERITGLDGTDIVRVQGANSIHHPVMTAMTCSDILRLSVDVGFIDYGTRKCFASPSQAKNTKKFISTSNT
jgi:Mating-type protein MAT alpha 1 HMG-box